MGRTGWWIIFGLSLLIAGIGGVLVSRALAYTTAFEVAEKASERSSDVIETIDALTIAVADAQRGMRGYLLTQDEDFLQPYDEGAAAVSGLIERLRVLSANRSTMREDVEALANRTTYTVAFASRAVALGKAGRFADAEALVRSGEGRRRMVATRQLIDSLKGGARFERETRRRLANQLAASSVESARMLAALGGVLALVIVIGGWLGLRHAYRNTPA